MKTQYEKESEEQQIRDWSFACGVIVTGIMILGVIGLNSIKPEKKNSYEKIIQQEKAKLDLIYQVKEDSLKRVYGNKLEEISGEKTK